MRPSHLRVIALATSIVLLAGCVGSRDDPAPTPTTPTATTPTATTPTDPTPPPPPPPKPDNVTVEDSGEMAGQFDKQWSWTVANRTFASYTVTFTLSGPNGLPPAGQVNLELADASGTVVKNVVLGLGGSANAVTWEFTAADVAATGDWTLRAVGNANNPSVPSGGIGHYALTVDVLY